MYAPRIIRTTLAYIVAPIIAKQKARYGKRHRHEETITYCLCDTILANNLADAIEYTPDENIKTI